MPEPEEARGTGMWIAVHDATVESGTMQVVPKSHRHKFAHARDTVSNHFISCETDSRMLEMEARAVPAEMPAGSAIFFSYGTAHATLDNVSDGERAALAYHFGPASLHDEKGLAHSYPGPEGKGNQSEVMQENPVVKILGTTGEEVAEELEAQRRKLLAGSGTEGTTRRWLTGPLATGGLAVYGETIEGTWESEVSRVLDGGAALDWQEGRFGSQGQRNRVELMTRHVERSFGRQNSAGLPRVELGRSGRL